MGYTRLLSHGRDWMTWRITDHGFAMTLSKQVPIALRESIAAFVDAASATPPKTVLVHPGGPGIIDAVDQALSLDGSGGIECSRHILQNFGNMSSTTVLFTLEEARRRGLDNPAMLIAFGPGLTIESIMIR